MVRALIAGGGTGGHVYPMLAVGQALSSLGACRVVYVGSNRGMETTAIPRAGGELLQLSVSPMRGSGVRGAVRGGVSAVSAFVAGARLVREVRPDVVLTVGGYAGGPVALAARSMGLPLGVLEPNGVMGFTNRLLAPMASRLYLGWGDPSSDGPRVRRFGVPLRAAVSAAPYEPSPEKFRWLVMGGSLGARALNDLIPATFSALRARVPFATLVHQTGQAHHERTVAAYRSAGLEVGTELSEGAPIAVVPYIDRVGEALAQADVVVQRSGASSLAELCLVGRASVLVPYPFAVDQHQLRNAESLERVGAAKVVTQDALTTERLTAMVTALYEDVGERVAMAQKARTEAKPEAAVDVARDLISLTGRGAQQEGTH